MSRRPPSTSYGYLAPPGARTRGWECNLCSTSDQPAPRSWPFPCPKCGHPADPQFEEPWAHEARGQRIRHRLKNPGALVEHFRLEQQLWAYEDAIRRADGPAADAAWAAYRAAVPETWREIGSWWIGSSGMLQMVELAAKMDDIDRAVEEMLDNYSHVYTDELEDSHRQRTVASNFITGCGAVLVRQASLDHPRADDLHDAMRDVARRAPQVLLDQHRFALQQVGELRALHRARVTLAQARRSTAVDGLPRIGRADIDAAIEAAELHDDLAPLAARDGLTGRGPVDRRHRQWRAAVEAPSSAAGKARLALAWAEWAVGAGIPDYAADAYQHLVALTAQDAVTRSGAAARNRVLAAAQEYAEEAGYWLGRAGRYREAVVALETGRAVGLTQALAAAAGSDPPMTEVRYADITAETGDGAIVYVASARAGGCAFVVAAQHAPQYIDLPRLDRAAVAALAADLLPPSAAAVRDLGPTEPSRGNPLADVLRALFDGGFDRLTTMAGGRVVTLVPVGRLTLLPIHAAGAPGHEWFVWHHISREFAVRYAPNARALRRCRETARHLATGTATLLAVDAPGGPGVASNEYLHHVARETAEVTRRWTGHPARPLHACTWAQFQSSAADHTVWHLACHGVARPDSIMETRLHFADRHVTLDELRRTLPPGRRRLAVLSACQTNITGSATPNEVVGLPSALIELGFAGVIATAWSVDDLATTYLMAAFYHYWCGEGAEPAVALNRAQRWLRLATRAELRALLPGVEPANDAERPYDDPHYWAPFAYTGA